MSKKQLAGFVGVFALVALFGLGIQAQAASWGPGYQSDGVPATTNADVQGSNGQWNKGGAGQFMGGMMGKNGIMGTVTSVNGTTLMVNSMRASTTVTYTIDASNATVHTNATTTITVSQIAVGAKVIVQGTVSGTTVTAKNIIDGIGIGMMGPGKAGEMGRGSGMEGMMMGKGMGVAGTVSAISGDILTVSSKHATTTAYSVDATNATVFKNQATSTLSAIAVGDTVAVQGTVSGTNVTATRIFDGKLGMFMGNGKGNGWKNGTSTPPVMHGMKGVFQKIGNFFKGLFHKSS